MMNEDQKPEVEIEINEKDFTVRYWQVLMKSLPKIKDYDVPVYILTTTNEITTFPIKSKDEKLYFIFPCSCAHGFWNNIFHSLFYNISKNLIIFERLFKKRDQYKQEMTITHLNCIHIIIDYTKDNRKFNIKITHLNYFKSNFESTRFLFIQKYTNSSSKLGPDFQVSRYFENSLEIPIERIDLYHSNTIPIEEVINLDNFFTDLSKHLPFCALVMELVNKETPFESFLDYGGYFSLTPFSKTECSLSFMSKLQVKVNLELRHMIQEKNKLAFTILFKLDMKYQFDFQRILIQTPKLNNQNLEFGENLIVFEYENFEKMSENMLAVLKFIKIKIFSILLKAKIDHQKKAEFKVMDEFDGKRLKIKVDKLDVVINFSEKPEIYGFIEKIENLPSIYENYLNLVSRLNYEGIDNFRVELEHHFAKILELIYLKSKYEPDRKRNITKGIMIVEAVIEFHQTKCGQKGALEYIKLEFEIQINEQNDEILNFKVYLIKKMKKNEVKEFSLKVKSGVFSFSADNAKTSSKETLANEETIFFEELNEVYEKFFDEKNGPKV